MNIKTHLTSAAFVVLFFIETVAEWLLAALIVVLRETLSTKAFKRYWRWAQVAFWAVDRFMGRSSAWFSHVTYLDGRVGELNFQTDEHFDGYILTRKVGDVEGERLNFTIENRWIAERGKLSNSHYNEIMSKAILAGYKVAYIYWNDELARPYELARLGLMRQPDDVVLQNEVRWYREPAKSEFNPNRYQNIIQRF